MDQQYVAPTKKILLPDDVEKLKHSAFLQDYLKLVLGMQKSVQGKKMGEFPEVSGIDTTMAPLLAYLEHLSVLLKETPCSEQPQRFGNKSFRTWLEKVWAYTQESLFDRLLTPTQSPARIELTEYLKESFGSHQRIDYGTGHELNFMLFLLCLHHLGLFGEQDLQFMTQKVFYKYIALMREVQLLYKLEPAGSHGVWGLDDYHFLPFLFGASELVGQSDFPQPADILVEKSLLLHRDDYMYANCVQFIKEVKSGPFHEHSPIIYDISGTPNWGKVALGMVKMYQAEVLFKFPVIKHTAFGSILRFP